MKNAIDDRWWIVDEIIDAATQCDDQTGFRRDPVKWLQQMKQEIIAKEARRKGQDFEQAPDAATAYQASQEPSKGR